MIETELLDQETELYYGTEQLKAYHVGATETIIIAGRAFGKSTNVQAPALYRILQQMPQSMIALLGASYAQLVERVLPALLYQGMAKFGLEEGEDYFVGKFAPQNFDWKKPLRRPAKGDHIVHWFQGSLLAMVSFDRPNLSNGFEFDAVIGDEARLFRVDQLQQFFQTVRGNEDKWEHLAAHQSKIFTTDYPSEMSGKWLLEKEKHHISEKEQELILNLVYMQSTLIQRQAKATSEKQKNNLGKEIDKIEAILNKLRKNKTYFKNLSTLENAFVIGTNTIKNFKNDLTEYNYDTSVLGVSTNKVEDGFYSQLSDRNIIESGVSNNYDVIDREVQNKGIGSLQRDCRWDYLFRKNLPIYIGIDCNAGFNTCVIAQVIGEDIIIQNNLWVIGKGIKELVKKFYHYYKEAINTPIVLFTNYTFNQDNAINADSDDPSYTNAALEWINGLRKYGFNVTEIELKLDDHSIRRARAEQSFLGDGLYNVKIVRENCQDLIDALEQVEIVMVNGREKKQKKYETKRKNKDGNFVFQKPPQKDTHSTDAFDDIITGLQVFSDNFDNSGYIPLNG